MDEKYNFASFMLLSFREAIGCVTVDSPSTRKTGDCVHHIHIGPKHFARNSDIGNGTMYPTLCWIWPVTWLINCPLVGSRYEYRYMDVPMTMLRWTRYFRVWRPECNAVEARFSGKGLCCPIDWLEPHVEGTQASSHRSHLQARKGANKDRRYKQVLASAAKSMAFPSLSGIVSCALL